MVTPVYQLNTPHCTVKPGKTCGGGDCVVCNIIMGADFATNGAVLLNQEQIRGLATVPDHGGLLLRDIDDAIKGLTAKFNRRGYLRPDVDIHERGSWDAFIKAVRSTQQWVIAFWDQPTWNKIVVLEHKPGLSGDLEFRGTHAISIPSIKWAGEKGNKAEWATARVYNPLWDGRRDQPTGTRVATGPQTVPLPWVRDALEARAGNNRVDFAVIHKAEKRREPEIDPCDRPTKPSRKDGKSDEGAI